MTGNVNTDNLVTPVGGLEALAKTIECISLDFFLKKALLLLQKVSGKAQTF